MDKLTLGVCAPDPMLEAFDIVFGGERGYGEPGEAFMTYARAWSRMCEVGLESDQVAACMIALKLERQKVNPKRDNVVDAYGYAMIWALCKARRMVNCEAVLTPLPILSASGSHVRENVVELQSAREWAANDPEPCFAVSPTCDCVYLATSSGSLRIARLYDGRWCVGGPPTLSDFARFRAIYDGRHHAPLYSPLSAL